uniref:Uncharacterized protein n=1 Tax=Timema tahoe TaxID=61484 RepID=A0A7R9P1X4_9NEOP|nr:unnamed protein product [Timema tahoe]
MVRFTKVVLHKAARRNSANGALQIGLCVSGQKAAQILRRLRSVLLNKRNAVRVLDIYGLFLQEDGTIKLDLFERFIGAPKEKVDMVHWNKKGMKLVENHLKRQL